MNRLHRDSQFQEAPENSYRIAGELFGQRSNEQVAVEEGSNGVSIHVTPQANVIAYNVIARNLNCQSSLLNRKDFS